MGKLFRCPSLPTTLTVSPSSSRVTGLQRTSRPPFNRHGCSSRIPPSRYRFLNTRAGAATALSKTRIATAYNEAAPSLPKRVGSRRLTASRERIRYDQVGSGRLSESLEIRHHKYRRGKDQRRAVSREKNIACCRSRRKVS